MISWLLMIGTISRMQARINDLEARLAYLQGLLEGRIQASVLPPEVRR